MKVSCLAIVVVVASAGCGTRAELEQSSPRLVELGRMLFFDASLSADGQVSCATCHKPERVFSDGLVRAAGVFGKQGTRNTPSILDVGRQRTLFWEGRRSRLEDQAADPLLNGVEHGLQDETQLLAKVRADPRYPAAFCAVFGLAASEITMLQVTQALAAFERTLTSGTSPFDRFRQGQRAAMSEAARHGWIIFDQQAHCTRCHAVATSDGQPPLFTDHAFHSLAVGFSKVERKLPRLTHRVVELHQNGRAFSRDILMDDDIAELGRFAVTLDPNDLGAFKTPGLRNVAVTAPYMHDGSVSTLREAVDLEVYNRGAQEDRPLILTLVERENLVAFLEALTSDDARRAAPERD